MNQGIENNKKTLIGIFNDSFPPIMDGVTLAVQNYARVLCKQGELPCVVTPWNPERYDTSYPVYRYFSLPIANRHPYRYGYPKLDPWIWRKLRNTPMRIVHSHSPFSAGRLGVYAARKQNIPLIGTFHSKYRYDLEHSFKRTPWMIDIIMKRILAFYNECDHVWIPQAAVADTVREYGYKGELTVVENGNDLASRFKDSEISEVKSKAKKELGISSSKISLLFVGQHIIDKGIMIIAEAVNILFKNNIDFSMHFIGQGYALSELARYIKVNGLSDCVTIHGVIKNRDELCKYYSAADIFLFPSFYDNAPLVVREAAAVGTPTIMPIGCTAAEVITDRVNGILSNRCAQDYANIITHYYYNRQELEKIGMEARRSLTRTWDDVMEEVSIRYSEIIKRYNHEHHNK